MIPGTWYLKEKIPSFHLGAAEGHYLGQENTHFAHDPRGPVLVEQ